MDHADDAADTRLFLEGGQSACWLDPRRWDDVDPYKTNFWEIDREPYEIPEPINIGNVVLLGHSACAHYITGLGHTAAYSNSDGID